MILKIIFIIAATIVLFRIGRFFLTPVLRKFGYIQYYSPMFCTIRSGKNRYDFHLGTSWDFFRQRNITPKKTLLYLARGLANLSFEIESGNIPSNTIFYGNTFYLKDSTAHKFGFRTRKLNFLEKLLFSQNYIELCILNSLIHKKIVLIRLKNVRIVLADAESILANRRKFESVIKALGKNQNIVSGTKTITETIETL